MKVLERWLDDAYTPPDTRRVDTCDGLRAIAILIVAWYHIWQQSWLYPGLTIGDWHFSFDPLVRSGYMWVDVMILISGFCLYLPWARMRWDPKPYPNTADFYAKRLIRIHPSYLLCVLVMMIVALTTGAYYTPAHRNLDIATHLTYTHTFFYDSYYASNLGGALWTVVIEMQFYVIFPLLARAFLRMPVPTFAFMFIAALGYRGAVGASMDDVTMYFNQLPAFLDTFALGMLAAEAAVYLSRRRPNPVTRVLCSALTVALIPLIWDVVRRQASMSGTAMIRMGQMNNRLAISALTALFLVFSANAGLIVRRILSNPVTRFVSAVSFQFYMWHQTLAVWLLKYRVIPSELEHPNYDGDLAWQRLFTLACFGLGLGLAALLTYGFERPVAKRLTALWQKFRSRKVRA